MNLTNEQLKKILPYSTEANRQKYLPYLNKYWEKFEVNTPDRQAAFLAQIGHESGSFKYTEEVASGTAYEGRKDLGNTQTGDGIKFKGHGLIQVTGRSNHTAFDVWLHKNKFIADNISVIDDPKLITTNPELAVLSAFWYWEKHNLNKLADRPL